MLIRLEDIGPGGQYGNAEQLGKLRAVLRTLQEKGVPYQIAVIPRWINIAKDGTRYDVSLDQTDNPYVRSFVSLLQQAAQSGAVIGMHGYTHQIGDVYRQDGQQESGIGNEFAVPDAEETMTVSYASERVKEGAELLERAGLFPLFWEAPHYNTLPEQDDVFRNYFGLHFQADMAADRNAWHPQYHNERNTGYGSPSLGAIYVPTPFSYIPYNRDIDIILNQLNKTDKLPAFFFHPFLEFNALIPVVDKNSQPVVEDGLPLYRYPDSPKSFLQRLLPKLEEQGYGFISITDFIPFVPAHSVWVGTDKEEEVETADVTGDGQADVVCRDRANGTIYVQNGDFRGLRNEIGTKPVEWGHIPYANGDVWTLLDDNSDGKSDLWVMRGDGTIESYRSDGSRFVPGKRWKKLRRGWKDMYVLRSGGGAWVIAGTADNAGGRLESMAIVGGVPKTLASRPWDDRYPVPLAVGDLDGDGKQSLLLPFPKSSHWLELTPDPDTGKWKRRVLDLAIPTGEDGQVKIGDFNGDGKSDILYWNADAQSFAVYRQTGPLRFELLSRMGRWGHDKGELFVSDMNGDGRQDVAEVEDADPYLDLALSFQSKSGPQPSKPAKPAP